jgi:hypothetical protein
MQRNSSAEPASKLRDDSEMRLIANDYAPLGRMSAIAKHSSSSYSVLHIYIQQMFAQYCLSARTLQKALQKLASSMQAEALTLEGVRAMVAVDAVMLLLLL